MARLWDKGGELDERIARFTVGDDYRLDRRLIPADCVASIAHVRGLESAGILSPEERKALVAALVRIIDEDEAGRFTVTEADEDGHTAIENHVVAELGDTGKKVHSGRSRNDQVTTALRMFSRRAIDRIAGEVLSLIDVLLERAEAEAQTVMTGRTHMQPAMLSTFGLWLASVAESLTDDLALLDGAYAFQDQSPLGAAASYGVPLPLDRAYTANLLGFARVQNNVLYAVGSRGKGEAILLDALAELGTTLARAAGDLIFFSLPEIGYVSLPAHLCTGSSIMPQKQNPDVLELVRGKCAGLAAVAERVKSVMRTLPAGYNRDVQETKGPFMEGLDTARACVEAMRAAVAGLDVHRQVMRDAIPAEVYATDAALELVQQGVPFREAYRRVGTDLDAVGAPDPLEALAKRSADGAPGNLNLSAARERVAHTRKELELRSARLSRAVSGLVGRPVELAPEG